MLLVYLCFLTHLSSLPSPSPEIFSLFHHSIIPLFNVNEYIMSQHFIIIYLLFFSFFIFFSLSSFYLFTTQISDMIWSHLIAWIGVCYCMFPGRISGRWKLQRRGQGQRQRQGCVEGWGWGRSRILRSHSSGHHRYCDNQSTQHSASGPRTHSGILREFVGGS